MNHYRAKIAFFITLISIMLMGSLSCSKGTLIDTVTVISRTTSQPSETTASLPPITIPPEIGKVLNINLKLGQGDAWAGGIRVSEEECVIGRLEKDFSNLEKSYKAGDPCIFFRGVMKNESSAGRWVRFWVNDLSTTLSSFGMIGYAGLFVPAGSSQNFSVPLKYVPDVTLFTVNAYISQTPPP